MARHRVRLEGHCACAYRPAPQAAGFVAADGAWHDGEEILGTFYNRFSYSRDGKNWRIPYAAERFKGYKAVTDMIDADTREVVVEAGKKLTVRQAKQLADKGLKAIRATEEDLLGTYLAEDIVNYPDR